MEVKPTYFISIEKVDSKFQAFISMNALSQPNLGIKNLLTKAEIQYTKFIRDSNKLISKIEKCKVLKQPIKAQVVWQLGDQIFKLTKNFSKMGLMLDHIYEHLARDLGKNPKWIGKAVTFRRYLPESKLISKSLNWSEYEKSTKRMALKTISK